MTTDGSLIVYKSSQGRGVWTAPGEDGFPDDGIQVAGHAPRDGRYLTFSVDLVGTITGGTFQLIFLKDGSQVGDPVDIPYNALIADVESLIEAQIGVPVTATSAGGLPVQKVDITVEEFAVWTVTHDDGNDSLTGTSPRALVGDILDGVVPEPGDTGTLWYNTDDDGAIWVQDAFTDAAPPYAWKKVWDARDPTQTTAARAPVATNAQPQLTISTSGGATGGDCEFILESPGGQSVVVSAIPYNASGVTLVRLLEGAIADQLGRIVEILSAGGPLGTLPCVLFIGENGNWTVTSSSDAFTGGSNPSVSVTLSTPGSAADEARAGSTWVDTVGLAAYTQVASDPTTPNWKKTTP